MTHHEHAHHTPEPYPPGPQARQAFQTLTGVARPKATPQPDIARATAEVQVGAARARLNQSLGVLP